MANARQVKQARRRAASMDVVDYSPSETYEVGQRIEHPARFGRGVVVELLDDGKMLVFFAEHGERTLVCGRAR